MSLCLTHPRLLVTYRHPRGAHAFGRLSLNARASSLLATFYWRDLGADSAALREISPQCILDRYT